MAKMTATAGGNLAKQIGGISGSLERLKKSFQRTDLGKGIKTMKEHAIRTADQLAGKRGNSLSRSAKRNSGTMAASIGRQLGGAIHLGRKVRSGAKASLTGTNSPTARYQRASKAFQGWAGQKATQFSGWRKTTGERISTAGKNARENIRAAYQSYQVNRKFNALMKQTAAQMQAHQAAQAQQNAKKQIPYRHFGVLLKKPKAHTQGQQIQQAAQTVQAQNAPKAQMTKLQEAIQKQSVNRKFHALMRKTKAQMQAQQAQAAAQPAKKGFFRSLVSPSSWASGFQKTRAFIQKMRTPPQQQGAQASGGEAQEAEKPKSLMSQISEKLSAFSTWLEQFGLAPQQIFAKTVGAAADLEKQMVLMGQVVKENKKKFTPEQVTQATKDYMSALRKNAVLNPFSVDEVTTGGMKTLELAKGDTTKAMNYMAIAENVAALKGEKLETVIEAFSEAKEGKMNKLNEFGFDFTKKDVNGKKGFDRMLAKVDKQFAGGSAKMGGTALGLWESIQEGFAVSMQDSGVEALDRLKPQLKRLQGWLTESGGGFDKLKEFAIVALGKITDGFLFLLDKAEKLFPIFQEMWATYVSPAFDAIGGGIKWLIDNFDELKPYLIGIVAAFSAFMVITKVVTLVSGLISAFSAGGAAIMALTNPIGWIAIAIGLLAVAWQKNWGGIREKVAEVIEWMKPFLAQTVAFIQGIFTKISDYFASIWPPLEVLITKAMPTVMVALTALWESFKLIFGGIFDLLKTWVTLMWNTVTSILEVLGGLFKALLEWASGDTEKAMQTLRETFTGFLKDIVSLGEDLMKGLGTFLENLKNRFSGGVTTLMKVSVEEDQKAKEKLSKLAEPTPTSPALKSLLNPQPNTLFSPQEQGASKAGTIPWLPSTPAGQSTSSPFSIQPKSGGSPFPTLLQGGANQSGNPSLTPAQKTAIFSSGSQGPAAQASGGNQVHIAQLVGEVHIHNEADEERFMKKLQRHLEIGLGLEGNGVGVG
ncbi:hypothetical protein EDM56_12000 [Brevibacillus fluminis]|uniref:Phage tail tape measure protein n=1 Tax=Brevibacillus fluminis TaxID=511487 RepID=A0A3M8DPH7_9BACL|nr:hypothetical protein [Brevibacillus fluminis]RNB89874.1 hypothetical protein EDM56_12000 [Brevibacillus fluminis]